MREIFFQILKIKFMELMIKMMVSFSEPDDSKKVNITKDMNFIVFDFETTGRSARFDQILQAGFIVYDSNLKKSRD